MKMPSQEEALKRAAPLKLSINRAVRRMKDKDTPLVVKVGIFGVDLVRERAIGPAIAVPTIAVATFKSWRVGHNPGDKYFELKLIPELRSLVLASPRAPGQTSAENFFEVHPEDLAMVYSAKDIKAITKLVDGIKPFPKRKEPPHVLDEDSTPEQAPPT